MRHYAPLNSPRKRHWQLKKQSEGFERSAQKINIRRGNVVGVVSISRCSYLFDTPCASKWLLASAAQPSSMPAGVQPARSLGSSVQQVSVLMRVEGYSWLLVIMDYFAEHG
jgi:hypothetical protein